ncbi:MAG: hydrogenase maturation protease [Desulfobacteraceae bacterium]|nr:hydrogenase maturation protease [Desulfobacteraceae bacterium]
MKPETGNRKQKTDNQVSSFKFQVSTTLVIGVGNTLREDDGVGINLVRRLKVCFPSGLNCIEVYEPDIILAQEIAGLDNVLIVDAIVAEDDRPYRIIPLKPAKSFVPSGGFVTHIFDWSTILAMSKELFAGNPDTKLLGVSAFSFGFSESLSAPCKANAEKTFDFLASFILPQK